MIVLSILVGVLFIVQIATLVRLSSLAAEWERFEHETGKDESDVAKRLTRLEHTLGFKASP